MRDVVQLHCPTCQTVLNEAQQEAPYRPFCSPRCKLVDLNHWLNGVYRISTPLSPLDSIELAEDDFKLGN